MTFQSRRRAAPWRGAERWLLSVALSVFAVPLGCGPAGNPRHLVVIAVDTLRADALGLFGSARGTSPNLDALGARSTVFERAWAQGTYTPSSFLSYMTSTHVRTHGWDYDIFAYPAAGICGWDDLETLAEVLARHGFVNEAFVSNPVLHPYYGFARGFQAWNGMEVAELGTGADDSAMRVFGMADRRVAAAAEEALGRFPRSGRGARHFLYLHLMKPHLPLEPSLQAQRAVGAPDDWAPGGRADHAYRREMRRRGSASEREQMRQGYLASVWEADRFVGSVLAAIERTGHLDDTIVVFLADHGEDIWEHGDYGHNKGVWQNLAHVPLVLRVPGRPPQRIERPVGLVDLAPTLLELLGVAERPHSWQGRSLYDAADPRIVVSERFFETAVTRDGMVKGVAGLGEKGFDEGVRWRYYDLGRDPLEAESLERVPQSADLVAGFGEWAAQTPTVERDSDAEPVGICRFKTRKDLERRERELRALGYLEE